MVFAAVQAPRQGTTRRPAVLRDRGVPNATDRFDSMVVPTHQRPLTASLIPISDD